LESKVKLKVFKNFKGRPGTGMKGFGTLLGARGNGFVMFWDWESGEIVRRIDVEAKNVSFLQSLFLFSLIQSFLSRFSGLVPVR
jgi:coatomer subunit beta'